jgi:hypothetical protein
MNPWENPFKDWHGIILAAALAAAFFLIFN